MKINRAAFLLVSWIALVSFSGFAQELVTWNGHALSEVLTVVELPSSVGEALGAKRPGYDGLADRGGKFDPTDLIVDQLPRRRFVVAGVNEETALVAVEVGGRGHYFEAIEFVKGRSTWEARRRWTFGEDPRSLSGLVSLASKSPPQDVKP